jgi:hypothetical protein
MARKKALTQGEIVVANIRYYKQLQGVEDEHLYLAARVSHTSWYKRLKNPETFSITELLGVAKALDTDLLSLLKPKEA